MPTTIGVNHYWPGEVIPTPLPDDGVTSSWNNAFVRSLPPGPNPSWQGPGWDENRPQQTQQGAQIVVFQIMGQGKSVDFVCRSLGIQGNAMTLWCDGHPEEQQVESNGHVLPWADYGGDAFPGIATVQCVSMPPYHPQGAIRHFLAAGKVYQLEIGSASYDSNAPSGAGFDQDFELTVTYTPEKLNDRRVDANDVIIWDDGLRYTGVPMLNTGYAQTGASGTDDPTSAEVTASAMSYLYWSAWWLYQPTKDGNVDVSWAALPQGANFLGMRIWRQNLGGTGSLTFLAGSDKNPDTKTVAVQAGQLIYIQIGTLSNYNFGHGLSQYYQVSVVGSKSAVQLPDPVDTPDTEPAADPTDDDGSAKPTPVVSDPIDPSTIVPIKPLPDGSAKQCSSILELVREFQRAAKAVVRIEGADIISIVDPNEPLPTGFTNGLGARYYSSTEQNLASDSKVLRLSKGNMDLNARAHLVTDDVGLITSGWRIPQRLPFPDLDPAPVSRVSYTFTPKSFSADVEFAFPDVPLKLRGS